MVCLAPSSLAPYPPLLPQTKQVTKAALEWYGKGEG